MNSAGFKEVLTALVTPFKNGKVDFESFKTLLKNQLDQGIQGFVVNGTTAESPCLTLEEVKALFDIVKGEASGPVIVGTGVNSTDKSIELSRVASEWGADALLAVTPYYNKPPQRGLIKHFKAIADNSRAPIILYNVPSRTITNLEPSSVAELSRHTNIIGIKDATGDMEVLKKLKDGVAKDFLLLSGDDASFVSFVANGGHGVIAVASHVIGKEMIEFLKQAREGKSEAANVYRERYSNLISKLYVEANPIPVKMALYFMKLIASPELRLPLVELDSSQHEGLKKCLKDVKKI